MSSHHGFRDLYLEELRDLYNAEHQLLKALPRMVAAASSPELRQAFADHLEETRVHAERLERIFDHLQEKPTGEICEAMQGLIKEAQKVIGQDYVSEVCDAALIASAQRVEHYEIAGYGVARAFARLLGEDEAARILDETLEEEAAADNLLNDLAENTINVEAVHAG